MKHILKVGDRVRVTNVHRWKPGRVGRVIEVEDRSGNRYVVRFNKPERGFYHDEKGKPYLLRLNDYDLEYWEDKKVEEK